MAGARRRYDHLPFFYSDLFDLGYEAVGDLSARHQIVEDWKEKFREGVVYLQMQGACSGCPSSTATLKHGIEGLLKHYVPEVTEVRAA